MDDLADESDKRWADLGEFIREQRRLTQLSLRRLAELSGVSNPYLSQIERGLRKPSAEILASIARSLEISSETLYVRAGILDPRDVDLDTVAAIRRDPALTEDHKRTLIHIYESFRQEAESLRGTDAGPAEAPDRSDGSGTTGESSRDRIG
ncbi:MAG: helix-turn-helix transcriptional regulator [Actinomycetota bacterium]|nr:helix-turn-helix transcriptional regulator [Actinomycetota bacterium]